MNMVMQFCDAIEQGEEYGFISNHYTQFTKEELADIIKEYIYNIPRSYDDTQINEDIVDCLTDYYGDL